MHRLISYLSVGVVIYTTGLVLIALFTPDSGYLYTIFYTFLIFFINFVLIYSVCKIRNTIKAIEDKFPNDTLMIVHLVNFIVYSVMLLTTSTLHLICALEFTTKGEAIDDDDMSKASCRDGYYAGFFQNLFYNYMTLFLMYLILRFSRERLNKDRKDPCLGKNVPLIVYVQN